MATLTPELLTARSWLFVPGDRERYLASAARSEADVLILDLEDGVAADRKSFARDMVGAYLNETRSGPARFVRVNAPGTPWFENDLRNLPVPALDGVCVPKVETPETLDIVDQMLSDVEQSSGGRTGTTTIVPMIETARGLMGCGAIAGASPRVAGVMLGAEDLAADLGLPPEATGHDAALIHARSTVVVAAAALGVPSVDAVFPDVSDAEGLTRHATRSRQFGFDGVAAITPHQAVAINAVFVPSDAELAFARRVVEAYRVATEAGRGTTTVEGHLVDAPIARRAELLLSRIPSSRSREDTDG